MCEYCTFEMVEHEGPIEGDEREYSVYEGPEFPLEAYGYDGSDAASAYIRVSTLGDSYVRAEFRVDIDSCIEDELEVTVDGRRLKSPHVRRFEMETETWIRFCPWCGRELDKVVAE